MNNLCCYWTEIACLLVPHHPSQCAARNERQCLMHILHPALQAAVHAPHGTGAQAVQKGKWSLCPLLSPQFCLAHLAWLCSIFFQLANLVPWYYLKIQISCYRLIIWVMVRMEGCCLIIIQYKLKQKSLDKLILRSADTYQLHFLQLRF